MDYNGCRSMEVQAFQVPLLEREWAGSGIPLGFGQDQKNAG